MELDKVNVIVFQDATPTGADVEGRMEVGGNAVFSGYGIANKDTSLDCSQYALVVGGDLTMSGGSVGDGKISYGGTLQISSVSTPCGTEHGSTTTPVNFAELESRLIGYSQALKAYPANGQVSSQYGTLSLVGSDPVLNVFDVDAAELNANLVLSAPAGSSVLVNVSGQEVVWQGVGFRLPDGGASCRGGSSDWCHRILYNMYEAQTVALSGIGVQGSILAPYATIDGSGGNVDGQVIVEYLRGGIEYHPYFFSGCLKPLPSPS